MLDPAASAQTMLRVGKAQPTQFAFVPADVGIETGIFRKHGLDVAISAFGGDARMVQALTAGSIDIALGGGPALASVVRGAPMKGVAALANEPNTILLVVRKDDPIKDVSDLKGKKVSVSTAGSLTYWLAQQLSRAQGWGDNGIDITPLGASTAQVAALKTRQIDGVTTDSITVYELVEDGTGRILVKFGDRIKNFHVHVIYASDKLIAERPAALRAFLAGWLETIRFMEANRDQTIEIAQKRAGISKTVASLGYADTMPIFNRTGAFSSAALETLAASFVDMKLLATKPDLRQTTTDAFLAAAK
jgi:ABC-type nitrate/sulfonate/bicarbonate transport system substrate-binding protein